MKEILSEFLIIGLYTLVTFCIIWFCPSGWEFNCFMISFTLLRIMDYAVMLKLINPPQSEVQQ